MSAYKSASLVYKEQGNCIINTFSTIVFIIVNVFVLNCAMSKNRSFLPMRTDRQSRIVRGLDRFLKARIDEVYKTRRDQRTFARVLPVFRSIAIDKARLPALSDRS